MHSDTRTLGCHHCINPICTLWRHVLRIGLDNSSHVVRGGQCCEGLDIMSLTDRSAGWSCPFPEWQMALLFGDVWLPLYFIPVLNYLSDVTSPKLPPPPPLNFGLKNIGGRDKKDSIITSPVCLSRVVPLAQHNSLNTYFISPYNSRGGSTSPQYAVMEGRFIPSVTRSERLQQWGCIILLSCIRRRTPIGQTCDGRA